MSDPAPHPAPGERCFARQAPEDSPPLFQSGNIVFQAHHVGWIVAGMLTIVSTVTSLWLVNKHLQWYTNKREQRYIVRLLFMVPIYSIVSLSSYLFWDHATALTLLRDGYESTVLTAFFYLLLMYISPNPDGQKAVFLKVGLSRQADHEAIRKKQKVKRWVFPLGFVKWKSEDGLYFLQLMKWGVLQYCVLRPLTTAVAVGLNFAGLYCETSLSPAWGHVYIVVIVSLSVTIAMYCLIQLYVPVAKQLAPHKPLLKLFAIKAVVFLTFWQATFLSVLALLKVVKDTRYMTAEDINVGIRALLETFEMTLFAFLHIRAFSYKPYRPTLAEGSQPQRTNRLKSLGHAFDFRETFRELWAGCVYMVDRSRGREPRPDRGARRVAHWETAFGQPKPGFEGSRLIDKPEADRKNEKEGEYADRDGEPGKVEIQVEVVDEVEPRLWLGDLRRERSEGLGQQIERELQSRGYRMGIRDHDYSDIEIAEGHQHQPQRSWWRSVFDRISQSAPDPAAEPGASSPPRRQSRSRHHSRDSRSRGQDHTGLLHDQDDDYRDPPPASAIRTHRKSRHRREFGSPGLSGGHRQSETDVLAPLAVFDQRHRQLQQPDLPSLPSPTQGSTLAVPQTQVFRNDSLLARVFPRGNSISSNDHGYGSAVSSSPSQATPMARLMPAAPVVLTQVPGYRHGSGVERYEHSSSPPPPPPPRPLPPPPLESFPTYAPQPPPSSQDVHLPLTMADVTVVPSDDDPLPASTSSFHRRESAHVVHQSVWGDVEQSQSSSNGRGDHHSSPKRAARDAKQKSSLPHGRETAQANGKMFLVPRKPPPLLSDHPNHNVGNSTRSRASLSPGSNLAPSTHKMSHRSPYQAPPAADQPALRRAPARTFTSFAQSPKRLQQRSSSTPVPKPWPGPPRDPKERFTLLPTRRSRGGHRISAPSDVPAAHMSSASPASSHCPRHPTRPSLDGAPGGATSRFQFEPLSDSLGRYPLLSPRASDHEPS